MTRRIAALAIAAALAAVPTVASPVAAVSSAKCFAKLPRGADYVRPFWYVKGKRVAYARQEDVCPNFRWWA